jgi:hypothetical protein|tara:strand:+ start:506 stop:673 length:168 start_codon:yes stop_codon:yes gene_type:complete
MIDDLCPKCGKKGCKCDPDQPCACDNKEEVIEEQILDVEESIKKRRKDIIESFEE